MKFLKYILFACLFVVANAMFTQVAIHANKYKAGSFFIDGKNDNSGTPSSAQINDIIVATNGYMGIGTNSPTKKLHIVGNAATNPVLRIADGSEAQGRVLTSRGIDGSSRWQRNGAASVIAVPLGAAVTFSIPDIDAKHLYSNTPISLPPGLWLIEVDILTYCLTGCNAGDFSTRAWLRSIVADSPTSNNPSADSYGAGITSRMACDYLYLKNYGFNMISGYFLINNKSGATKTYYYNFGNGSIVMGTIDANSRFSFGGSGNESTIYATYIDEAQP